MTWPLLIAQLHYARVASHNAHQEAEAQAAASRASREKRRASGRKRIGAPRKHGDEVGDAILRLLRTGAKDSIEIYDWLPQHSAAFLRAKLSAMLGDRQIVRLGPRGNYRYTLKPQPTGL